MSFRILRLMDKRLITTFRTAKLCLSTTNIRSIRKSTVLQLLHERPSNSKVFATPKKAESLRLMDGLGKSYELIYRNDLTVHILLYQAVVAVGFAMMILVQAVTLMVNLEEAEDKKEGHVPNNVKEASEFETQGFLAPEIKNQWITLAIISVLLFSLYRLQRSLPVRIYIGPKDHSIAVGFGSIIPGKKTYHEFVAGQLTKAKPSIFSLSWQEAVYKDANQRSIVLFERHFRSPADFQRLISGIET